MIEAERAGWHGDSEAEAQIWLERLAKLDAKRSRFQDMAAEGHITFEELGAKLRELGEQRTKEEELGKVRLHRARLEDLQRDKATLLRDYARMVPEALDEN